MNEKNLPNCPVVLQTGFRIFFLGALVHAIISIWMWMGFYALGWDIFIPMPINIWHGHEMIYGFTMAVVAGFLLTAVMNWTGRPTLQGTPLLVLFLLWAAGRVLAFMPGMGALKTMVIVDCIFLGYLIIAVSLPIIKTKQWHQSAVLSKVIILFICNIFFFQAVFNNTLQSAHSNLLFAVYMMVSLIFTIGRRVIPFFVGKALGSSGIKNSKNLDMASLVLIVLFSIFDSFWPHFRIIPVLAACLVGIHIWRLKGWYLPGIWKKPLLWILFVGYAFLIIGFILKVFCHTHNLSVDYSLHAFTYGGIGIFTLGMMARVALGHTGRDVQKPSPLVFWMFIILIVGACVRIFLPIINEDFYLMAIVIGQLLWMLTFILFAIVYIPILVSKRPDGKWG
ncbi:NnrS protein involved in response to NO [hydrothermal vent metagenome]|uniref:NnrS protein involved in response to NO n=1 Tax=hydrothermal vent metagenome TaxID=652676 RepID=A0A3B1DHM3_9ZZZZ